MVLGSTKMNVVWEDFVNEEGNHKEPMVCVEYASTTMLPLFVGM
jgi:hypothetical protein